VGDVHGCALELDALLKKMAPGRDDILVMLGDYVDRGPHSRSAIDVILDWRERCTVVALKGNHEAMFDDFRDRPEAAGSGMFILNGGAATLASYGASEGAFEIPKEHVDFYRGLQLFFETETHFFVHAGVPEISLDIVRSQAAQLESQLLWVRQPFLGSRFKWEKVIVHGHTPSRSVETTERRINLDTGCVFDGVLSGLDLSTGRLHSIERDRTDRAPTDLSDRRAGGHRIALRFAGRLPVEAKGSRSGPARFATLNFNQFGLLIENAEGVETATLSVGETLEGRIGVGEQNWVAFVGRVVRVDRRGSQIVYGVQLDRITAGADGKTWIQRPGGAGS
jgi:serine/threonine protein phosphatase 1